MDQTLPLQKQIEDALQVDFIFDIKRRPVILFGKKGVLTYIIGYTDPFLTQQILSFLMEKKDDRLENTVNMEEMYQKYIPYGSCETTKDPVFAAEEILRGSASLTLSGFDDILLLDIRDFPNRGIEEPEKDRTLRGPHIGTNESLLSNLIQIRRLIRSKNLQTEKFILGTQVKNEVALLSVRGKADENLLEKLREKLRGYQEKNLSMTQETLSGYLFPRKGLGLFNPFPKARYTERPDVVAASLIEGKIAILCDNTPSVLLLPQSLFDFFEETDDYYFPPLTGSYLRIIRFLVFLGSIFIIPLWLYLVKLENVLPTNLDFLKAKDPFTVPLFLQFLIIEFAIDGLKMASLNTPSTLSGSFSVIGGLLLGEYAVKSGWFVPQTILYSAFTGIANFIPTSIELAYSFKFIRISLIILVEFFGLWGLISGTVFWMLVLFFTKGTMGKSFLYPFIPFDQNAVKKILLRTRFGRER